MDKQIIPLTQGNQSLAVTESPPVSSTQGMATQLTAVSNSREMTIAQPLTHLTLSSPSTSSSQYFSQSSLAIRDLSADFSAYVPPAAVSEALVPASHTFIPDAGPINYSEQADNPALIFPEVMKSDERSNLAKLWHQSDFQQVKNLSEPEYHHQQRVPESSIASTAMPMFEAEPVVTPDKLSLICATGGGEQKGIALFNKYIDEMSTTPGNISIRQEIAAKCSWIAYELNKDELAKETFYKQILNSAIPPRYLSQLIAITAYHISLPPAAMLPESTTRVLHYFPNPANPGTDTYDISASAGYLTVLFSELINAPDASGTLAAQDTKKTKKEAIAEAQKKAKYQATREATKKAIKQMFYELSAHRIPLRALVNETHKIIFNSLRDEACFSEKAVSIRLALYNHYMDAFKALNSKEINYYQNSVMLWPLKVFATTEFNEKVSSSRNMMQAILAQVKKKHGKSEVTAPDDRLFFGTIDLIYQMPQPWRKDALLHLGEILKVHGTSGNQPVSTALIINSANYMVNPELSKLLFEKLKSNIHNKREQFIAITLACQEYQGFEIFDTFNGPTENAVSDFVGRWKQSCMTEHQSAISIAASQAQKAVTVKEKPFRDFNFLVDYIFSTDQVLPLLSGMLETLSAMESSIKTMVVNDIIDRNYSASMQTEVKSLNKRLQNLLSISNKDAKKRQALVDSIATIQVRLLEFDKFQKIPEIIDNLTTNLSEIETASNIMPILNILGESFNHDNLSERNYFKIIVTALEKLSLKPAGTLVNYQFCYILDNTLKKMNTPGETASFIQALSTGCYAQSVDSGGISGLSKLIINEIQSSALTSEPFTAAKPINSDIRQALNRLVISSYHHWQLVEKNIKKARRHIPSRFIDIDWFTAPADFLLADNNVRRPMLDLLNQERPEKLEKFFNEAIKLATNEFNAKTSANPYPIAAIRALNSICRFISRIPATDQTVKVISDIYGFYISLHPLQGAPQPVNELKNSLMMTLSILKESRARQHKLFPDKFENFMTSYFSEPVMQLDFIEYEIVPEDAGRKKSSIKPVKSTEKSKITATASNIPLKSEELISRTIYYNGVMPEALLQELNSNYKFKAFMAGYKWRAIKFHHEKDKNKGTTPFCRVDFSDDNLDNRLKGGRSNKRGVLAAAGENIFLFIGTASHEDIPKLQKPYIGYDTSDKVKSLIENKDYDFTEIYLDGDEIKQRI